MKVEVATEKDVNEMLNLYRLVYGKKYPISYGTDPDLLKNAITNKDTHLVIVSKDSISKIVTGAMIVELDKYFKIGKLVGLVVHPDYQKHKIGQNLVSYATTELLDKSDAYNSLYATTRTVTVGPQVVFLRNNYLPLGIFPNAHRLHQYETVTLFAKFKKGVLEKRIPEKNVVRNLMPLYNTLKEFNNEIVIPKAADEPSITKKEFDNEIEFEIIQAPNYVLRKFHERFPNKEDRFFPFHSPNMLIADKEGRIEIFAHFSKRDGYCTLIKSTIPINELNSKLTSLNMQLDDLGVAYLEVLVNVKFTPFINMLLRGQFVPSAIYPAMREINKELNDYVVLSRTMEPLNFRGMAIVAPFKPYIDQYVEAWKKINLDTIEVVYDSRK
jgi:N-acetylglutamate synthase-like GNAT family acetyltransferase